MSSTAAERDGPFVTPDDWRVAARVAHSQNRRAVQARLAGDDKRARDHQGKADWFIAKARLWRKEWAT